MKKDLTLKETAVLSGLIASKVKPLSRVQLFRMACSLLKDVAFSEKEFDEIFQNLASPSFHIARNKVQIEVDSTPLIEI